MTDVIPDRHPELDIYLRQYDRDWGLLAKGLIAERGVSPADSVVIALAMQIAVLAGEMREVAHPKFRENCPHCEHQKIVDEYMRKSLPMVEHEAKHLDDEKEWRDE